MNRPVGVTRSEVADISQEEIRKALGIETKVVLSSGKSSAAAPSGYLKLDSCPRQPHKGKCPSGLCRKAGYHG